MAPRANWKGFLRLSLVTCPIALFPATSESEKISFNQINRKTGNRIRYLKVDADTGDEVAPEDIIKGYKVDTGRYLEVTKDELENIALESTRTIEIDEFVPRSEIDDLYLVRPYYIVPDGKVGHDAYAVIRETIRSLDKVAIARVGADEPRAYHCARSPRQGTDGHAAALSLRGPRGVRIFRRNPGRENHEGHARSRTAYRRSEVRHFEPGKFEDHYEAALSELLAKKQKGLPITAAKKPAPDNVVNLMDALRASIGQKAKPAPSSAKRAKAPAKKAARSKKSA